jgi:uroporphyrinogen-III decarboxylase
MFEQFVLPYHLRLSAALRQMGCPSLLHCCGHVNAMLESYAKAGWDGLEPLTPPPLGNVRLDDAKRRVGDRVCLKGNIDPVHVLKEGSADRVAESVRECLAAGGERGFIFSVADCMAPGTRREHMEIVSDIVHHVSSQEES